MGTDPIPPIHQPLPTQLILQPILRPILQPILQPFLQPILRRRVSATQQEIRCVWRTARKTVRQILMDVDVLA